MRNEDFEVILDGGVEKILEHVAPYPQKVFKVMVFDDEQIDSSGIEVKTDKTTLHKTATGHYRVEVFNWQFIGLQVNVWHD